MFELALVDNLHITVGR
ncbi:uncharacterized protein CELE_K11D12.14 [Caenorhabditis elegans]|uniref:Uncharacterized protein n=1 Tax=Caenorhabditis elegans TaxID=6239 RepID=A0A2K5ATZ4_CAEEL|nr:Uncharacterized protein CELE_K11D12.14 [Caenorhabditis elegans]SPC47964.2 Uncharacterized protein CELE_K11D12.14 [Caenorhabditis elegans]|eukprot:NP_001348775.2 Uncharacterized protein CELE_K11D12.14 [Caenorhabditis elegans]